jgi:hypothetical protein
MTFTTCINRGAALRCALFLRWACFVAWLAK